MALSTHARRTLKQALGANHLGKEVADIIDAGSGTLSTAAKNALIAVFMDRTTAGAVATAINAGTAITGPQQAELGIALGSRVIAAEIAAALAL
jgi:hypothetical protein